MQLRQQCENFQATIAKNNIQISDLKAEIQMLQLNDKNRVGSLCDSIEEYFTTGSLSDCIEKV